MDLLATVRKEGSRGGRGEFKWSEVQASSHRENYLGHSLMAPVGRWQKGRDLNWYAKADKDSTIDDQEDPAAKAARERKEEILRVKQAEEDALARALGLPVAPRNPNLEELGAQRDVGKAVKEAAGEDDTAALSRGVGYGRPAKVSRPDEGEPPTQRLEGTRGEHDEELRYALKEYKRRHGEKRHRHRSRSRSRSKDRTRERDRKRRHRERDEHRPRNHRLRSRSPQRDRLEHKRSRSLSVDRDRDHYKGRQHSRSRSPGYRRRESGHSQSRKESYSRHERH